MPDVFATGNGECCVWLAPMWERVLEWYHPAGERLLTMRGPRGEPGWDVLLEEQP